MVEIILIALAVLSIALNLWQWQAGRRFPMRRRLAASQPLAPLSILKPLRGADSETEACLRSWFAQTYPAPVELLFGVADETDPACAIVRKLAPDFPERVSKLVICSPLLGANGKVSSLCYLAKEATHEHLVISDADVEVPRDFLEQLLVPLQDGAGLVNCFYMLRPLNVPMALEAVAVNADFWTQVLQATTLKPMDFALGAVMATTQSRLAKAGRFESLLDDLADDYQLGNRIAKAGGRLEICPQPVTCWTGEQSPREVFLHQLRWARTIRVCQPAPYFFSILNNATLWPLLALLGAPGATTQVVAQAAILLRVLTAKSNYQRLTGENGWIAFGLAPLKDLLAAVIWIMSWTSREVIWRGQRFRVDSGGKLAPRA